MTGTLSWGAGQSYSPVIRLCWVRTALFSFIGKSALGKKSPLGNDTLASLGQTLRSFARGTKAALAKEVGRGGERSALFFFHKNVRARHWLGL